MKIEEAIERLQELIEYKEEWVDFFHERGETGYRLRDTELELEALRMAKRALEEKPRWIPCMERLPEMREYDHCGSVLRESDKVLCCTQTKTGGKNIVLGYYAGGKWRCGMNNNVVAWMPLPEAYEEEHEY